MKMKITDATLEIDASGNLTIELTDGYRSHEKINPPRVGGYDEKSLMSSALSFLYACGDSINYAMHSMGKGEHTDLFDQVIGLWAASNLDAISIAQMDIDPDRFN